MTALRQFRGPRASALFPALAYAAADGLFLLDDASLAFGFLCEPLAAGAQGEADRLSVLLKGLAQGHPAAGNALGLPGHRGAARAHARAAHRARGRPAP